jgi:TATA-box binding protein (TBP) (component of TFIID and TFIIIB)
MTAVIKQRSFEDIKVSTKTFTAMTNMSINLEKLFEAIPVVPYIIVPKKRGRKKKVDTHDPNKDIPVGSVITLKLEKNVKGVDLKKKKKETDPKWFRNSLTVVIILDKHINFKVYKNGTFQMTGCMNKKHAELCVTHIWKHISEMQGDVFEITRGEDLEFLIIPAMRNIDFDLGFCVDREKLALFMSTQTDFHCLLETSFGYTGVNIKIPLEYDIQTMMVKKVYTSGKSEMVPYTEYLDLLPAKDKKAKISKDRYNTFLVFHSGKTILSGLKKSTTRETYYEFLQIMQKRMELIREKLDVDTESEEPLVKTTQEENDDLQKCTKQ